MTIDELREAIKAQRNRCDTALLVCSHEHAYLEAHLLHTLMEDIHEYQQAITDEFCVASNE